MGKRIDAETKAQIVELYLSDDSLTYAKVAKHFGVATESARKIINEELEAGNDIKPDRRVQSEPPTDSELDQIHEDKMDKHPRTSDWMQHITPLHKHKQALELAVEHKQAELDAAKQELRDFTATLRQLMEGDV